MPNLVTALNWTPIFEWYVIRCGFKNGYQKDMYLIEIGLRAQNMIPILGSIVNIIGGNLYDHLISTRILTLIVKKILYELQKLRKVVMASIWIC